MPSGASYRVIKSTANGNAFVGSAKGLVLGENIILISEVAFDRYVKIQFSSGEICFDSFIQNNITLYPESSLPVIDEPEPEPESGLNNEDKMEIGDSELFGEGPNSTWQKIFVADTLGTDGSEQLIKINILEMPEGSKYRVVKSTANGNAFVGNAVDFILGENIISVPGVSFDRYVKLQFSSGDICFDSFIQNDIILFPSIENEPEPELNNQLELAFTVSSSEYFPPPFSATGVGFKPTSEELKAMNGERKGNYTMVLTNGGIEKTSQVSVTKVNTSGNDFRYDVSYISGDQISIPDPDTSASFFQ